MSAFIVSRETLNRAVSLFDEGPRTAAETLDNLGTRLWRMNAQAVSQRYNEPIEALPRYLYTTPPCTTIVRLKAACCLRYQCSEGDIEERALFKQLADRIQEKISEYVCSLPEWDEAEWDAEEPTAEPIA